MRFLDRFRRRPPAAPVTPGPAGAPAGGAVATFEATNGSARIRYRTTYTGADEFSRSYLAMDVAGGTTRVRTEELGRWCMETFALELDVLRGGQWVTMPFSWEALEGLVDAEAIAVGEAVSEAALEIWLKVVKKRAANLDALKKTSLTASERSSSGETPSAPSSPIST